MKMIDKGCPFYQAETGGIEVCKASVSWKIPTALEQKTFCTTADCDLCPTFLGHTLRVNNISRHFIWRT